VHGLPDVGLISLAEALENVRRICSAVTIPVIADVDDGGATPIHIRRTVEMAERAGAAGIMIEDVDSSQPKHLWIEEKGYWDFSTAVLYPTEVAVDRLSIAMAARSDPEFVVIARTDAVPTDAVRGYDLGIERARVFAALGANMLTLMGLTRERVTSELTSSLGAPLLVGENAAVSSEEKERLFAAGASLMHGLLPLVAGFSGYQQMIQSLKQGTPPAFDRDPYVVNKELLETVDLPGWTRALASPRRLSGMT
jgi:2,3-dimethylmalate lyase